MPRRRGDNIPSISDYSHWNEEAASMWYAENKYDMDHAGEPMDDDDYDDREYEEDISHTDKANWRSIIDATSGIVTPQTDELPEETVRRLREHEDGED